MVQTEEIYRGKPIFYSLGNFVFDQDWSHATLEGLVLEIKLSHQEPGAAVASITPVPVLLRGFRPEPATGAEAKRILGRLGNTSYTNH